MGTMLRSNAKTCLPRLVRHCLVHLESGLKSNRANDISARSHISFAPRTQESGGDLQKEDIMTLSTIDRKYVGHDDERWIKFDVQEKEWSTFCETSWKVTASHKKKRYGSNCSGCKAKILTSARQKLKAKWWAKINDHEIEWGMLPLSITLASCEVVEIDRYAIFPI